MTTALTLRAVLRLALRQAEGLMGSIITCLGWAGLGLPVPDHATLSRRAETLEVLQPGPSSSTRPYTCWWSVRDRGYAARASGWRRSTGAGHAPRGASGPSVWMPAPGGSSRPP